ncbi:MAG: protein O-mannosyl-transferase family, partial [Anaerolineae bacterium]
MDTLTGAALFAAGLAAYTSTLAPTVLNGDAALFQYTPLVLGVTYPTGYPVYLLLARLWLALVPVGEVAWRMNLFSAGCGALALPFLYGAARRLLQNRAAAVSSVLLFATLPTYWRWATEAKIYTLNILLFSIVLWLAARGEEEGGWPARLRYTLAALALGLQVGVHSTTALLIPGVLLLFRLNGRAQKRNRLPRKIIVKQAATHVALFALPLTAYLYVPLRAEWLIARYGRETAIARGLLADFYHSGLSGWLRYFTAADFTGGVVTNWGNVPAELFTVYFDRLLPLDFTGWGVAWGLVGMLIVSLHPPLRRRLWPFFLLYALPIPFVLTYGQGEQNAFLLTSNLTFALFAGAAVAFAIYVLRFAFYAPRTTRHASQLAAITLFALTLLLPIRHTRYNLNWLQNKWNTASREYWAEALAHPLEEGAGVMATWGDLTSMWYMQHAEGRRPDLPGLYPPTEAVAADWLARGNPLYVAGPVLDDWPPAAVARYRLIPWGRLVRLTPRAADPRALLPPLDPSRQTTFGGRLRLLGADFPAQVPSGGRLEAYFSLLALSNLPEGTLYSLRLAQGDSIVAQRDDAIRPGWFPRPAIPAGQPLVGAYTVDLPPGTLPGEYRLQLAVYHQPGQEWRMADGSRVFDLGPVAVQFTPAAGRPGPDRFGRELALDESRISVKRARQGKGFALHLLWRTLEPPADNYTLLAEMVDGAGQVWRDWRVP